MSQYKFILPLIVWAIIFVSSENALAFCQTLDSNPRDEAILESVDLQIRVVEGYAYVRESKLWYNPNQRTVVTKLLVPFDFTRGTVTDMRMILDGLEYQARIADKQKACNEFRENVNRALRRVPIGDPLLEYAGPGAYYIQDILRPRERHTVIVYSESILQYKNSEYILSLNPSPGTTNKFNTRFTATVFVEGYSTELRSSTHTESAVVSDMNRSILYSVDEKLLPGEIFKVIYSQKRAEDYKLEIEKMNNGLGVRAFIPSSIIKIDQEYERAVLFLIENSNKTAKSGSMEKTKSDINTALSSLRNGDRFNVVGFSSSLSLAFPGPVPVSEENISKAQTFLYNLKGNGGSNIALALQEVQRELYMEERPSLALLYSEGKPSEGAIRPTELVGIANQLKNFKGNPIVVDTIYISDKSSTQLLSFISSTTLGNQRTGSILPNVILKNVDVKFSINGIESGWSLPTPWLEDKSELIAYGFFPNLSKVDKISMSITADSTNGIVSLNISSPIRESYADIDKEVILTRTAYLSFAMEKSPSIKISHELREIGIRNRYVTPLTSFILVPGVDLPMNEKTPSDTSQPKTVLDSEPDVNPLPFDRPVPMFELAKKERALPGFDSFIAV
ncbi:MAG: hypothetical protein AB1779_07040, partial [Candidatus Thermoplasmatota archaeon]